MMPEVTKVQLTVEVPEIDLIKMVEPHIEARLREGAAALKREHADSGRVRPRHLALDQAINNVARASARVDSARNSRDEQRSIQNLIAAADGLRRLIEARQSGL